MKLNYFQLLSSTPIYIPMVGGIISPTLQDIADIGGDEIYQNYLNLLLMDDDKLIQLCNKDKNEDIQNSGSVFDILVDNQDICAALETIFNFFMHEDVTYSSEHNAFLVMTDAVLKDGDDVKEEYQVIGFINKDNYKDVVDVICQRNNIQTKDLNDASKTKSKKALAILDKLKKGRESLAKTKKADANMELGNIISAVANKSQSLNMTNIWGLTVFQLWDSFARLNNLNAYSINAASVSAWGDKDKKFDFNGWFKKLTN